MSLTETRNSDSNAGWNVDIILFYCKTNAYNTIFPMKEPDIYNTLIPDVFNLQKTI